MKLTIIVLVATCLTSLYVDGVPLVLRESSPSGESIVAISTSDTNGDSFATRTNDGSRKRIAQSISVASSGKTGTGRSFASASSSAGHPYLFPFYISPFQGFPINDWVRNVESFYDPSFAGHGESITAVNENGHIYGEINGVPFDNSAKSDS
uniref:Uncharacterized protein n=1 Tax=Bombyx mori TaxID=7091 RepID=A0A8R1WKZ8_BOMMO|nr:uncharacterized protein LOC101746734 isoform X1 [Bombyx mori]